MFTRTYHMPGGGVGRLITLPAPCAKLVIYARGECWVNPTSDSAAEAPAATPAPAASASTPYMHLKDDEDHVWDLSDGVLSPAAPPSAGDKFVVVQLWSIDEEDLLLTGNG